MAKEMIPEMTGMLRFGQFVLESHSLPVLLLQRMPGYLGEPVLTWRKSLAFVYLAGFFLVVAPAEQHYLLLYFWGLLLALLLLHAGAAGWRQWRGDLMPGEARSWLSRNPRLGQGLLEPLGALLVGILVLSASKTIGIYLIVAGFTLALLHAYQQARQSWPETAPAPE